MTLWIQHSQLCRWTNTPVQRLSSAERLQGTCSTDCRRPTPSTVSERWFLAMTLYCVITATHRQTDIIQKQTDSVESDGQTWPSKSGDRINILWKSLSSFFLIGLLNLSRFHDISTHSINTKNSTERVMSSNLATSRQICSAAQWKDEIWLCIGCLLQHTDRAQTWTPVVQVIQRSD